MSGINDRIHSLEVCALVLANEPYMQAFVSTLTPAQCNQLIIQAYSNNGVLNWLNLW